MLPINKPRTKAILRIGPLCSLHKYSFVSIRTCATEAGSGNSIKNLSLNPDWVTGFVDAEGSFLVLIFRYENFQMGWAVKLRFIIHLHEKDSAILEAIKSFFNVGIVSKRGEDSVQYRVASLDDLTKVIIPQFENYPLITQKLADFILFKKAVELIMNKKHLTKEGLEKIISIKGNLNLGLSTELKKAFPDVNLDPKIK